MISITRGYNTRRTHRDRDRSQMTHGTGTGSNWGCFKRQREIEDNMFIVGLLSQAKEKQDCQSVVVWKLQSRLIKYAQGYPFWWHNVWVLLQFQLPQRSDSNDVCILLWTDPEACMNSISFHVQSQDNQWSAASCHVGLLLETSFCKYHVLWCVLRWAREAPPCHLVPTSFHEIQSGTDIAQ